MNINKNFCRIAHVSTLHKRWDSRIVERQAKSSAKYAAVDVFLFDGVYNYFLSEFINIFGLGKEKRNIILRIFLFYPKILFRLMKTKYDFVHLHDPELLPLGFILTTLGRNVIYDAHEDYPEQFLNKPYLSAWQQRIISKLIYFVEICAGKYFWAVTSASEHIDERFKKYARRSYVLPNYPLIKNFTRGSLRGSGGYNILYVGSINKYRGINQIVSAIEILRNKGIDAKLLLAGNFHSKEYEEFLRNSTGSCHVDFIGVVDREKYNQLAGIADLGIVMDHPLSNYVDAYATKMFEYMAYGLPVVLSDFPLWVEFLKINKCGVAANPLDPGDIALKLEFMFNNPHLREEYGCRGRESVEKYYSWESVEQCFRIMYSKSEV